MPAEKRFNCRAKADLRWSKVVVRATYLPRKRYNDAGGVAELQLIEMNDKMDKMDK